MRRGASSGGPRKVFNQGLKGRVSGHGMMPLDYVGQAANDAIRDLVVSGRPCLVARFGSAEIEAILRGYDIKRPGGLFKLFLLPTGRAVRFGGIIPSKPDCCARRGCFRRMTRR